MWRFKASQTWHGLKRLRGNAGGGGEERKGFALSRSPTRVDIYVDDFSGPLMFLRLFCS